MKKTQLTLLLLLSLFLVGSCSKDNTSTPTNTATTTCLIQKIVYGDGSIDTYTFDSKNRLITNINTQDTNINQFDYVYNGNTVVASIGPITFNTFYLNSKGYADSSIISIPSFLEMKTINTFNSSGLIISKSVTGTQFGDTVNELTTYQYTGGNITKEIYNNGKSTTTTDYEYYLDKVDQSKKSYEAVFFENTSVNLRKKETDNTGDITNITYEFDADGKVTKRTNVTTGSQSFTTSNTYTWNCK